MLKKQITILIIAIITAVVFCGVVSAATHTVGPNPSDDYNTISAAVGAAGNGDTIQVNPNNGNPYIETIGVDHALNIVTNGAVTVQKPDLSEQVFRINPGGSGSTVQGFTFTKTDAPMSDQAIFIAGADNCNILNNNINGFCMGISISTNNPANGQNNMISGNTINSGPNAVGYSYGINIAASNNQITYNTISTQGTGTGLSIGIPIHGSSGNQIIGNSIVASHTDPTSIIGILSNTNGNTAHFNRIIANTPISDAGSGSTMDALYNWYGSNGYPSGIQGDNIQYNPWLRMVVSASETLIYTGGTSTVTADFTHDSTYDPNNPALSYHNPTLGHFPDGLSVLFQSTGGSISAGLPTSNGLATATFTADSGPGLGVASGTRDAETESVGINIVQLTSSNGQSNSQGNTSNNQVNAATSTSTNTVGMQNTGAPMGMLLMAVLLMFAGLIIPRRK